MTLMARAALVLTPVALLGLAAAAERGQTPALNAGRDSLAVHGYDVVAYFVDGAAVRGRPEFEYRWQHLTWRFASDAHRAQFASAPERYAPQFGGYCAWAVSRGYTADIDPTAWRVVDGRLYLNYSHRVQRQWEQDVAGNIAKARDHWPGVLAK